MSAISSNGTGGGLWSDTASWVGAVVPISSDDVTVVSGDTITYDLDNTATAAVNTITVAGVFEYDTTKDTGILFADSVNSLYILSGGTWKNGSAASPNTFLSKTYFPQGTAARNVVQLDDGAIVEIHGDPNFYGNFPDTTLKTDWATGSSFDVVGDAFGWQVGQKIYVNQNLPTAATSTSYQTDADFYTISAVSSYDAINDLTTITVSESFVTTSYAGGLVVNCSRNIEHGDPGNVDLWNVYAGYNNYTQTIQCNVGQSPGNALLNFTDVLAFNWNYAFANGYNLNFGGVFVSNNICIKSGGSYTLNGVFASNNIVISGSNHIIYSIVISNCFGIYNTTNDIINGNVVSNYYGIIGGSNHTVNGDLTNNYYGSYGGSNHTINGNVVSNNRGINYGANHTVYGNMVSNNYGIIYGSNHTINGDLTNNITDVYMASNSILNSAILEDCTLNGTSRQPLRLYLNSGNFLPVSSGDTQWQTPPSNLPWELEAIPNSYCKDTLTMTMRMAQKNKMYVVVPAGLATLTYKIYPLGWTALDITKIRIRLRYLDTTTGITRTEVLTPSTTFTNDAWQDLFVTFVPAQSGVVYFNLEVAGYEAGATILIDPQWKLT